MGLSDVGIPLSHEDTMKWAPYVRKHGVTQFINLFKKHKNRSNDPFKWGDEIEYTFVKFDETKKEAKLSLTSHHILQDINDENEANNLKKNGSWTPEYGAFMIEGTPSDPYEELKFCEVEKNMKNRRKEIKQFLKHGEELICVTSFPRLGCKNFTSPKTNVTPNEGLTKSLFFPDGAIYPGHPRYKNTTKNILGRRGEKAYSNIPIFKDKNTKFPVDNSYKIDKNALPDHVYVDALGFGSGYSCLQVTFQGSDLEEARVLYDQLAPFCPIMMALTAAAPFHRGFITDIDTRWNILCNTHDCRTEEERGLKPLRKNTFVIPKSRYDSIDCYISQQGEKYNDNQVLYHEEDYKRMIENDVDPLLAQHISHLFIRDTISMFKENIYQNDEEDSGHFENIQSTNWQSLRFKPPLPNSSLGWRVEFRPCDLQITDFENAAIICFLILLTRITLTYKLNFLIPISKVDENIQRAQKRNAIKEQKFWFRKNIGCTKNNHNKDYFENISNRLNGYTSYSSNGENIHVSFDNSVNNDLIQTTFTTMDLNGYSHTSYRYHSNEATMKDVNNNIRNGTTDKLHLEHHNDSEYISCNENGNIQNIIDTTYTFCNVNGNIQNSKTHINNYCNGCFHQRSNSIHVHKKNGYLKHTEKNELNEEKMSYKKVNNDEYIEMTVNEIINGKKGEFIGIIPLMHKYLYDSDLDTETQCKIQQYLKLIGQRTSGEVLTTAAWMRKFVLGHPEYRHDSVITEEINYDLLKAMQMIQNEELSCPELLGHKTN